MSLTAGLWYRVFISDDARGRGIGMGDAIAATGAGEAMRKAQRAAACTATKRERLIEGIAKVWLRSLIYTRIKRVSGRRFREKGGIATSALREDEEVREEEGDVWRFVFIAHFKPPTDAPTLLALASVT